MLKAFGRIVFTFCVFKQPWSVSSQKIQIKDLIYTHRVHYNIPKTTDESTKLSSNPRNDDSLCHPRRRLKLTWIRARICFINRVCRAIQFLSAPSQRVVPVSRTIKSSRGLYPKISSSHSPNESSPFSGDTKLKRRVSKQIKGEIVIRNNFGCSFGVQGLRIFFS